MCIFVHVFCLFSVVFLYSFVSIFVVFVLLKLVAFCVVVFGVLVFAECDEL